MPDERIAAQSAPDYRVLRRVLSLMLLIASTSCWQGAVAESVRVAAYLPEHSRSVAAVMTPWLDRVEARAGGRLTFERYWGGSLGRGPQRQVLLVEAGVSELAFLWPGMTPGRFPDLQILEAPMLVRSATEGSLLAWQLYEAGLIRGFDDVVVIGFYTVAPARLFLVDRVASVTSLDALKIRTVGPVQSGFVRRVGALPETLEAAAVSDALRRGTIDGLVQGWTGMQTFRQYRYARHVVDVAAGVSVFALVMNRGRFDALDADLKRLIMAEGGAALARAGGEAFDRETALITESLLAGGEVTRLPVLSEERKQLERRAASALAAWVGTDPHRQRVRAAAESFLNDHRRGAE